MVSDRLVEKWKAGVVPLQSGASVSVETGSAAVAAELPDVKQSFMRSGTFQKYSLSGPVALSGKELSKDAVVGPDIQKYAKLFFTEFVFSSRV